MVNLEGDPLRWAVLRQANPKKRSRWAAREKIPTSRRAKVLEGSERCWDCQA